MLCKNSTYKYQIEEKKKIKRKNFIYRLICKYLIKIKKITLYYYYYWFNNYKKNA